MREWNGEKKKEREQNERYVQMMIEKVCSRKMSDVEPFDSRTKKKNQKMKRTFCFENCGDGELKRGCCLVFSKRYFSIAKIDMICAICS